MTTNETTVADGSEDAAGTTKPTPLDLARRTEPRPVDANTPAELKKDLFTPEQQAEVDRIIRDRVQRVEAKYATVDVQASELRLKEIGQEIRDGELRLLRNHIAERIGLSPEDRDLLLTGTDVTSLEAQAALLAQRGFGRAPGNVARREGQIVAAPTTGNEDMRTFVNDLFGNDVW